MGQNNYSEANELIKKQLLAGPASVYEPIVKVNSNHDEKGRFSSGNSGPQVKIGSLLRTKGGVGMATHRVEQGTGGYYHLKSVSPSHGDDLYVTKDHINNNYERTK